MIYYIFRFLQIWSFFAAITLLFSLIVMCCSYNIYEKMGKKIIASFIPVYNLLVLLDIVKMSRWCFILLLLPFVNMFVILLMMYRLSIVFRTSAPFAFGLILLPVVFLPILNFSNYLDNVDEEEKKDDVTNEMVTLMTEEQVSELNKTEETEPKVDNVFKAPTITEEPAPTFKANKIKYREMVLPEEKVEEIKKVEPVQVQEIYTNRFINTNVTEEDDSIEIVEL